MMLQSVRVALSMSSEKYIDPFFILSTLNSSKTPSNDLCKSYINQLHASDGVFRRALFATRLMLVYLSFWQYERGYLEDIPTTIQTVHSSALRRSRQIVQWIFVNFEQAVPTFNSLFPLIHPLSLASIYNYFHQQLFLFFVSVSSFHSRSHHLNEKTYKSVAISSSSKSCYLSSPLIYSCLYRFN
jgi:hypothetical protein